MATTEARAGLLIDRFAPRYDIMQAQHLVVDAPPAQTYAAVRSLDFTDVGGFVVDAAFWVRGLPERLKGQAPERTPLTFDTMTSASDWVVLGERAGEEIAAGVAGRFWKPVIEWKRLTPEEFTEFAEPGFGKIVFSLSVRPYGETRSLVTYDVRVTMTDSASHAKFRAYWAVVAPFVRTVQAAALRTIARHAVIPEKG